MYKGHKITAEKGSEKGLWIVRIDGRVAIETFDNKSGAVRSAKRLIDRQEEGVA